MIIKRYHLYKMDMIIQVWSEIQNFNLPNTQTYPVKIYFAESLLTSFFSQSQKLLIVLLMALDFAFALFHINFWKQRIHPHRSQYSYFHGIYMNSAAGFVISVYIVICALRNEDGNMTGSKHYYYIIYFQIIYHYYHYCGWQMGI